MMEMRNSGTYPPYSPDFGTPALNHRQLWLKQKISPKECTVRARKITMFTNGGYQFSINGYISQHFPVSIQLTNW
ncbi:hypothetical protein TNIN_174981 [Trichonephila inaurata madagascariensis]|uniref:Uncharacterized protein n=1 Tax=Trichonephila inaurata madagascariensis TaxID=2747483 RepID=A0A8X6XDA4_9ARAC|nr:hypothetical protein TNIN_174981 [Trichonephila inaurata madagascariensis]